MTAPSAWAILVADDDHDVLAVTELALMGMRVEGQPVECVGVGSARAARAALESRRFAVAILDVVMETDDAGLGLVEWIRARPEWRSTRIVVRTGQPGIAPRHRVLADYDINDYWPKTGISAPRSRVLVAGLIRSFRDLEELEARRSQLAAREVELEAARAEAERASRAKTTFLASVNHELRTPLAAILGLSELALEAADDARMVDLLSSIHVNAQALNSLVSDVLDLSRIEAGVLAVVRKPLSLRTLVEEVADLFAAMSVRRGVQVYCRVDPGLPTTCSGDRDRVFQLLMNLAGNAAKYTRTGHVRIEARRATARPDGRLWVELRVTDTGQGMAAGNLAAQRAMLLEGASPVMRVGSRLGLSIAAQLVDHLGGRWTAVDSTPGAGSTFALQLPFESTHDSADLAHPTPLAGRPVHIAVRSPMLATDVEELVRLAGMVPVDTPVGGSVTITDISGPDVPGTIRLRQPGHSGSGVALPLVSSRLWGALQAAPTPSSQPDSRALPPLRVLLVEGPGAHRDTLAGALVALGMAVTSVDSGSEAIATFLPARFDVVLIDVELPDLACLEVVRRFRGHERSSSAPHPVPVIGITAHPAGLRSALLSGWLARPVRTDDLQAALAAVHPPGQPAHRVLVVEDSPVLRMLTAHHLELLGFRTIETVDTGEAAVELAPTMHRVLMDLDLPGIDGLEAIRRIRREGFTGPIHLATAFDDPDLDARARRAGADGVLRKPLQRSDLEDAVSLRKSP